MFTIGTICWLGPKSDEFVDVYDLVI